MSADRSRQRRRKAEWRGRMAERLAAWRYRLAGFRLVAARYRTPLGEIDLILRRRSQLVFAEVKARCSFEAAAYALQPRQRERLAGAASVFLRDHPVHTGCSMRFDLVAVRPWRWPRLITDAWRLDELS